MDVLLDSAASGWNTVEREGISISHPARFILVGSGNPEEGELRPQLLDRFGMHAQVWCLSLALGIIIIIIIIPYAQLMHNLYQYQCQYLYHMHKLCTTERATPSSQTELAVSQRGVLVVLLPVRTQQDKLLESSDSEGCWMSARWRVLCHPSC